MDEPWTLFGVSVNVWHKIWVACQERNIKVENLIDYIYTLEDNYAD